MSGFFRKAAIAGLSAAALILTSLPAGAGQILYGIGGANGPTGSPNPPTAMLYTIDTTTGAATPVGDTGFSHIGAIGFHPGTGVLYGISNDDGMGNNRLITIDTSTGAGTFVTNVGAAENWPDMGFASNGTLYSWAEELFVDSLHTINLSTGAATLVGLSGLSTNQTGLAVNSSDTIYLKDGDGSIYTIDPGTGAPTFVVNIGFGVFDNALAFDMNDVLYTMARVSGNSNLYTVDLSTGANTLIGATGIADLSGLAFRTTMMSVPEPGALAILLLGLAGIGAVRIRHGD